MRALCALLASLPLAGALPARGADADAAAAVAVALSLSRLPAPAVTAAACPCSEHGDCPCSAAGDCGCVSEGGLRWVATSKPGHYALYRGWHQIGNWRAEEGAFYDLILHADDTHSWRRGTSPAGPPPAAVLRAAPAAAPAARSVAVPTFAPMPAFAPSWGNVGGFSGGACAGGG